MKVIGIASDGKYIAEVSHVELEKLTDKYYGKLDRLKTGDSLDLGQGWDFRDDIKRACDAMVDASKRFDASRTTLHSFAVMVSQLPGQPAEKGVGNG